MRKDKDPRSAHVVVLSAHTATSLRANKSRLAEWLCANPTARLEDIAYTTTARRVHQPTFRFAVAASSTRELTQALESHVSSSLDGPRPATPKSPVILVFSGQGSHYAGMGAELYQTSPVFRDTVDLCRQICDGFGFPPFLNIITEAGAGADTAWNTAQTQLALVTLQVALVAFWRHLGVEPALVVGHSLGEYAALHTAGVLSLADTLYLVGIRAALAIDKCDPGACAMLAVSASATELLDLVNALGLEGGSCSMACFNSPGASVVSGTASAVARLHAALKERNVRTKMLPLPFGFHSSQVDAILDDFRAIASGPGITYSPPSVPVASTFLASVVDAGTPARQGGFNADYLAEQARNPVDFVGAVHAARDWAAAAAAGPNAKGGPSSGSTAGEPVWLEIGPGQVCASFVHDTLSPPAGHVVSTLSASPAKSPWATISECLASLYVHGSDPDWLLLHAPFEHTLRLLTLPSYAWDVKDFWISYRERNYRDVGAGASGHGMTPAQPISTCAQYVVDKTTKAGKTHVTLGASLSLPALLTLIQGHRMQGVGLCPGSVFCEAAFVAAKCALEHSGRKNVRLADLSLQKAHLRRPLTASLVGPDGSLCTTAVVESESLVLVSFKATSRPRSPARSFDLGSCAVAFHEAPAQDSESFYIRARMREVTRTCKSRLPASIFYALFSRAVQYGSDHYRCVREAFVSDDFSEAVAEVVPAVNPPDLHFVASSPYWGEALAHLAGFLVNCDTGRFAGEAQPTTSFIMDSLERFEQTPEAIEPGRSYFTYARVLEKTADTAVCEVVVFDDKDRLVMRTWRMRFHEVPDAVLQGLLPKEFGQEQSIAVLKPSPGPGSNLLPDSPELDVLDGPNDTAYGAQVVEREPAAEQSAFQQDEFAQKDSDLPKASPNLLPVILESIAEETGLSDTSELTEDVSLADLGVDSIMAVEICARIKTKSGHQLSPSFILEHPTIGNLVRVVGGAAPQQQQQQQQKIGRQGQKQEREQENTLEHCKEDDAAANRLELEDGIAKTASPSSCSRSTTPAHTPATTPPLQTSSQGPVEAISTEPPPKARIMLLQRGRPRPGAPTSKARLYLVCDGTGSISNYIHLLKHQFPLPVYGIDSPFLRCPSRLTPQVGIPGVARGMVEALISLQPSAGLSGAQQESPILLAGFSGGAMFCYEMCRQLADQERRVGGLVILDMRCPLPPPPPPPSSSTGDKVSPLPLSDRPVWEILFTTAGESMAGQVHGSDAESNTTRHLRAMFESVLGYHPPRRAAAGPALHVPAVVIWCARGMVGRLEERRPDLVARLVELGYPVRSYPGYMEDPRLGAMAWSVPHKETESDLGPGGWENFVGAGEDGDIARNLLCLAVDVDHHGVLYPTTAPKAAELIDQGVAFLLERKGSNN